ncbi:MAG: ABC transporter permease [Emcibacteraceae bacterium]
MISASRNILKHKLFSTINIFGLSIGLAAVILISLFVRDELSYDKFWKNADNIYRMHQTFLPAGREPLVFTMVSGPIVHALKKDFPQVEEAARISNTRATMSIGDLNYEEVVSLVDPSFVKIFDFKTLDGNLENTLENQNNIVLNHTLAEKLFPHENALGKTLTVNADAFEREFIVSAVIEDMPENSQVNVSAMVSIVENEWLDQPWMFDNWFSSNSHLYFSVSPNADIQDINDQMPAFIDRNFPSSNIGEPNSKSIILSSQNIRDLHLKAQGKGEFRDRGSINIVLTFSAVAALILIIASINFMNLSIARASQRAKEVSLRKVLGASRKNLVAQFIGESIFITFLALFVSVVIVEMVLPFYNEIIGKNLALNYTSSDLFLIILFASIVGILGGTYPALILSKFRPAEILKTNKSSENGHSVKLRAALVIFQFAVSITLFVSTAVVYGQVLYTQNFELGFNKENLLIINNLNRDEADKKLNLLIDEFKRLPNVINVTWSDDAPGKYSEDNIGLRTPEMTSSENLQIGVRQIGYNYFETYRIPLLAGRYYDDTKNDRGSEIDELKTGRRFPASLIINETGVKKFGFSNPQNALGKILYRNIQDNDKNLIQEYQIIGVIPDIHLDSLKKEIRPEVFELIPESARYITLKYSGDSLAIVNQAHTIWKREIPSIPFSYNYAVDQLEEQYHTEQGEMTMFVAFSALAILIASLGLYGLASFTAERRTKEIGIRKVMGATVYDIVKLLVWQFSKPVMLANLIAWPVSYYAMSIWLEGFAYRIESIFILGFCAISGIAALMIAWITVAGNSMRVARANPIKALRYE